MSLASAVGAILSEKNEGLLDRSLVMGTFEPGLAAVGRAQSYASDP